MRLLQNDYLAGRVLSSIQILKAFTDVGTTDRSEWCALHTLQWVEGIVFYLSYPISFAVTIA